MGEQQYYKTRFYRRKYIFVFLMCIKVGSFSATAASNKKSSEEDEEMKFCEKIAFSKRVFSFSPKGGYYKIHDLYCKTRSPLYRFFFAQYTTSTLHYYAWTVFSTILKKFIGVVKKYKVWWDFEFYYGSVVGVGWYPQFLNFSKNFRMGFFDVFINFISLFMRCCHFFCHVYFDRIRLKCGNLDSKKIFSDEKIQEAAVDSYIKAVEDVNRGWCKEMKEGIKETAKGKFFRCSYSEQKEGMPLDKELDKGDKLLERPCNSLAGFCRFVMCKGAKYICSLFLFFIDFSLLNIETCYGIKIKMLTSRQIQKFFKTRTCSCFKKLLYIRVCRKRRWILVF